MRKRYIPLLLAVIAFFGTIGYFSASAGAETARPFNLMNVPIINVGSNLPIQTHGVGNLVTVGSNASEFSQIDCISGSTCEWRNGSGDCLDASQSNGLIYDEACHSGDYTPEEFAIQQVSGAEYWFFNRYWSNHCSCAQYMTQVNAGVGSDIGANYGPGFGNAAVWLV